MRLFNDRFEAAAHLADALGPLRHERPLVLAVPNGGVPVALPIARALDATLDILLIARVFGPDADDEAIAAVDEHGRIAPIDPPPGWNHVFADELVGLARQAFRRLQRRRSRYRAVLTESEVRGRTVIIVSEGITTGAAMAAAVASVRDRGARRVIVAAPAAAAKAVDRLRSSADEVVVPHALNRLKELDTVYQEHDPVTDQDVEAMLRSWITDRPELRGGVRTLVMRLLADHQSVLHCEIDLPSGMTRGSGPYPAVIHAHGLESHGRSPRIVPVSRQLAKRSVIGIRVDFTGHGRSEGRIEDATPERLVSDLRTVLDNTRLLTEVDPTRVGLSGSGSGGLASLQIAADEPDLAAIVVRGPLTGGEVEAARSVAAPTLFIHGEHDPERHQLQPMEADLPDGHEQLVIPESNRLFNDPISLELMVASSVQWLAHHLAALPSTVDASDTRHGAAG